MALGWCANGLVEAASALARKTKVMQPITYRFSWSHNSYELAGILVLLCVFFALSFIPFAVRVAWPFVTSTMADVGWRDWYLALWAAPFWALLVGYQFLRTSPRYNFVHLDDAGLAYTRLGKSHRWRWSETGEIRPKKQWLDLVAIEFDSPSEVAWHFRVPPWSISRPASGPKTVMLPDVFEAPLDDIAAKLNEYRNRALGNGAVGPGVQT